MGARKQRVAVLAPTSVEHVHTHVQVPRQPVMPRALRRAEREPSHREDWATCGRAPCAAYP